MGFKNGTDGDPQTAIDAMVAAKSAQGFLGLDHQGRTAIIRTTGNPDGHLVLRGGNSGPNFGADAIAQAQTQLRAGGVRSRLLVDCSHGNSYKEHHRQADAFKDVVNQRIQGNHEIIGCMLESNLYSGKQPLEDDLSQLKYGVSITDACIGWEETEELLNWLHGQAESIV